MATNNLHLPCGEPTLVDMKGKTHPGGRPVLANGVLEKPFTLLTCLTAVIG